MSQVQVQEVYGQFAVVLADGPALFPTEAEALAAGIAHENAADFAAQAAAYCAANDIEADSKNAKGKTNVIVDFLNFQATYVADVDGEEEQF